MLYDAHLHAGMFPDVTATVRCALDSRIIPVLVGIHLQESESTLKTLSSSSLNVPVFVGIHPWYAKEHRFDSRLMEKLVASPLVKGIGECGLDNKIELSLDEQITLLRSHLDVAAECDLPVNLHIRGYHGELYRVLKSYNGRLKGIVHNFTFSEEIANKYLDLGMYLSVGHHLINPSEKMVSVIGKVGIEHLVLETDADYIHTGEYDPVSLKNCYKSLSSILNLTPAKIEHCIEQNLKKLMSI